MFPFSLLFAFTDSNSKTTKLSRRWKILMLEMLGSSRGMYAFVFYVVFSILLYTDKCAHTHIHTNFTSMELDIWTV